MRILTFLESDVSIPWGYLLLQMLFLRPMYLQRAFLWTCRYFSACLACIIVSTSCLFWNLRMLSSQIFHLHLTFSIMWGYSPAKFCIFNLFFPWLADTVLRNFASSISKNPLSQISSTNILQGKRIKNNYYTPGVCNYRARKFYANVLLLDSRCTVGATKRKNRKTKISDIIRYRVFIREG